jgi:hypothetical protein
MRYTDSVLGLERTQTDYYDYRHVDGVRVPFWWTLADPHHISAIQLKARAVKRFHRRFSFLPTHRPEHLRAALLRKIEPATSHQRASTAKHMIRWSTRDHYCG